MTLTQAPMHDAEVARASVHLLARHANRKRPLTIQVKGQSRPLELPGPAVTLLIGILDAMAAGQRVTLLPESAELTTVQAARVLNVSRPFLIKLLDENAIPHRKVGKHRRIRLADALAYKTADDRARGRVLDQLARQAQRSDMGY